MAVEEEGRSFGLEWSIRRDDDRTTVRLAGDLDMASVEAVSAMLVQLVQEDSVVVVDLARLRFLDSTGLRLLGRVHQTAKQGRRQFLIGALSPAARRVFQLSGLVDFFDYDFPQSGA